MDDSVGLTDRRPPVAIGVLAVVVALMVVAGGCGWFGGGGPTEAGADPETGADTDSDADGDTESGGGDGDGGGGDESADPATQIALGEITDPDESADPGSSTPDTTPPSEARRLRAEIQAPLSEGEWRIADERATEALERTDLDPRFRIELEAYRDLARAADAGDEMAADDAIDRLRPIEPGFVENLAVRQVLPDGVMVDLEMDPMAAANRATDPGSPEQGTGVEAPGDPAGAEVALDAAAEALAAEDWKEADRLLAGLLVDGSLAAADMRRAEAYADLAEAQLDGDTAAVARATDLLAGLDPDLATRLEPLTLDRDGR